MPNELPPGVAIEPIFVAEATHAPDAAERRPPLRAADAAAALAIARDDVYLREGIWVEVTVHAYGRVCRPEELSSAEARARALAADGSVRGA